MRPSDAGIGEIKARHRDRATGGVVIPGVIVHIPVIVAVGIHLLKTAKGGTIQVRPRAISVHTNTLIVCVFADVVRACGEVQRCIFPGTGLARRPVPIRYLARRSFSELQRLQVVRVLCGI